MIHDSDYRGPRWVYGCLQHPLTDTATPDGRIIGADREHERFPYGTVSFTRALTALEVFHYRLAPIGPNGKVVCDISINTVSGMDTLIAKASGTRENICEIIIYSLHTSSVAFRTSLLSALRAELSGLGYEEDNGVRT